MSTNHEESQEKKLCRYCLADSIKAGNLIFTTDENSVYEEMVTETFNIQIHHPGPPFKMLCSKCVEDFTHSALVKQNILAAQKVLLEQNEKLHVEPIKQESEESDGYDEDYVDYKETPSNRGNSACKQISSDTLQDPKTNIPFGDTSSNEHVPCEAKNNGYSKESELKSKKTKKRIFDGTGEIRRNTLNLISNSNMCLFKSKKTKYLCYFCKETYLDIREIRKHSTVHAKDGFTNFKRNLNYSRGLTLIYVDISNLTCKICTDSCQDLTDLSEHLNKHGVASGKAGHLLVPFKLEQGFECVTCHAEFLTFSRLLIHMNSHSKSNICEICGTAYMNRLSLRNHIKSLHTLSQCTQCSEVFSATSARSKHMRAVHNKGGYKRYCPKCDLTFLYTHQLTAHMVEKHGRNKQTVSCELCGKIYANLFGLRVHIREVHVGERNFPCSKCEMRFFTSTDRKRHEITHGSEKLFSCDICDVRFRSKDSQKRHLRRQHKINDSGKVSKGNT